MVHHKRNRHLQPLLNSSDEKLFVLQNSLSCHNSSILTAAVPIKKNFFMPYTTTNELGFFTYHIDITIIMPSSNISVLYIKIRTFTTQRLKEELELISLY